MKFHGEVRFDWNEAVAYFSLKTTVLAFGASILSTAAYAPCRAEMTLAGGNTILLYVATTSSLVIAVPSWNLTSVRSLTVQVSLSADTSGIAAATSGAGLVRSFGSHL